MIKITDTVVHTMRIEGEKAYPNECCGVMLGRSDSVFRVVDEILPIDNARESGEQYHRFLIEADELMQAEVYALHHQKDVLGFYHSHPDHPASPSRYDHEHALPFYSYVIVSVANGKAVDLTSWELTADRKEFLSESCHEIVTGKLNLPANPKSDFSSQSKIERDK